MQNFSIIHVSPSSLIVSFRFEHWKRKLLDLHLSTTMMMYSFSGDKVNEFKKGKYSYTKERLLKAIIIVVKDIRLFYAFDQSLKY